MMTDQNGIRRKIDNLRMSNDNEPLLPRCRAQVTRDEFKLKPPLQEHLKFQWQV